ncbi:hypothetical protein, partial [Streptomyces prasinopilosus]|uniref:hypothetical protein n=1 Tax=Streptomyces prasinopilosus TaxID=67344 RepID=UPI003F5CDB21
MPDRQADTLEGRQELRYLRQARHRIPRRPGIIGLPQKTHGHPQLLQRGTTGVPDALQSGDQLLRPP